MISDIEKSARREDFFLDYRFNEREIKLLASLFRKYQAQIPDGLIDFMTKIERKIYNSMTIEEAEEFYS